MFKKILVPLDGSALAERALPIALQLARATQGELILFRVPVFEVAVAPAFGGYGIVLPDQSLEHARAQAREYLRDQQKYLNAPDVKMRVMIVDGDVASAIVDLARAEQVDLIVMSTHGYSGVTRWVLGSVTERVLSDAPCPVYVARTPDLPHSLLITLDGSALSERALPPGLEVGATFNAKVTLLSAVREIDSNLFAEMDQLERGMAQRLREDYILETQHYLRDIAQRYHRDDLSLETATTFEPAAQSILEFIETHEVDLVVMATHGRTGVSRWLYGSVTEKVLREAQRSILVVRSTN